MAKGSWSAEEDNRLRHFIYLNGGQPRNWVKIADQVGSRNAKQCRERYHQNLRPDLREGPIRPEEAALILEMHRSIGPGWAQIARMLPGRSDNSVKNWFNLRKNRLERANQKRGFEEAGAETASAMAGRQPKRQQQQEERPRRRQSRTQQSPVPSLLTQQRPLPSMLDLNFSREQPIAAPQISPFSDGHPPSLMTDSSSPNIPHPSPNIPHPSPPYLYLREGPVSVTPRVEGKRPVSRERYPVSPEMAHPCPSAVGFYDRRELVAPREERSQPAGKACMAVANIIN